LFGSILAFQPPNKIKAKAGGQFMFEKIELEQKWPLIEEKVLEFWDKEDIFQKGLELSKNRPSFVFYEGPPTANGKPGIHHVLARIYKDLFCRYKTMKGFYVPRKAGWDTHGLPVELEVEKRLKISGKKDIEEFGIAEFIAECKKSIFTYKEDWDKNTKRIAYWLDLNDPYITCSNSYIESIWWALKKIYEKGLIFKGHKVVPHCPRCQTTLSAHEVAQGYDDHTVDPSVFIKFPLEKEENTFFLVWTTTPWTLTANVALAIQSKASYVKVVYGDENLILAKNRLEAVFKKEPYEIISEFNGKELIGQKYKALFPYGGEEVQSKGCRIVATDFVGLDDGTGIVHLAPAFGADDMNAGIEHDLPVLITVELNGVFKNELTEFKGLFIKDADKLIINTLKDRKLLFRSETIVHTYPFCWRCQSPLVYLAKDSWFIKTSSLRSKLLAHNDTVKWYPQHIQKGRFGEWLKDAKDWAISRERFWGTPLNIWECSACNHIQTVGSIKELEELSKQKLDHLELHRPFIDEIEFDCPQCNARMHRVKEVLDCWLDSGSMPFAQHHYPFECPDFEKHLFPADFISEGIDQTRGWFYTMLVMNSILFDQAPYKSVLTFELVLDEKGEKMSKSRGNVVDVNEMIDQYGTDAIRWSMFFSSTPYVPRRFSKSIVSDGYKNFILPLLHVSSFFVTYANIDQWKAPLNPNDIPRTSSFMDCWIISRMESLIQQVNTSMDQVDVTDASKRIAVFVDDLSNWYIRRSRRRFWRSESDQDKLEAYATLYYVLYRLCLLIAPFVPFASEYLFSKLTQADQKDSPSSVHWMTYPEANESAIDLSLEKRMNQVREWISAGLRARKKAGIKVRFPLSSLSIITEKDLAIDDLAKQVIMEELNLKNIHTETDISKYATLKLKPNLPVLGKKAGKQLPQIKQALSEHSSPFSLLEDLQKNHYFMLDLDDKSSIKIENEDFFSELISTSENHLVESAGKDHIVLKLSLTPVLLKEGLSRELIHFIQNMRKEADFEVSESIEITCYTNDKYIQEMIREFKALILSETLAKTITLLPQTIVNAKTLLLEAPDGFKGEIELAIGRFSF
jgi:isoleucyl-tRNA synthetase